MQGARETLFFRVFACPVEFPLTGGTIQLGSFSVFVMGFWVFILYSCLLSSVFYILMIFNFRHFSSLKSLE
jgi:hypothetical protein